MSKLIHIIRLANIAEIMLNRVTIESSRLIKNNYLAFACRLSSGSGNLLASAAMATSGESRVVFVCVHRMLSTATCWWHGIHPHEHDYMYGMHDVFN